MWNERYAGSDYVFGTEPAAFVSAAKGYLPASGTALCVADGEGRNSVWLAQQGLDVTAFDFAPNALSKARDLARARGVQVDFRQGDILEWDWGAQSYDVVAAVFIQFVGPAARAEIFAGMTRALAPGGLLLLHGYAPRQVEYGTGGPSDPQNMYTTDMLAEAFAGFDVLRLQDYDAEISEGAGHSGRSALVDFIARKPKGD